MKSWSQSLGIVATLIFSCLFAEAEPPSVIPSFQDEIEAVDRLIDATKERLEVQVQMKQLIMKLRDAEDELVQGIAPAASAQALVQTSRALLDIIDHEKLHYVFSAPFLEELHFLSQMGAKRES